MCRLPKARLVSVPLVSAAFVSKFLLFSLLLWPAASLAQTFTFTAIPDQDESRLVERFGRVERYLEERLGIETVSRAIRTRLSLSINIDEAKAS